MLLVLASFSAPALACPPEVATAQQSLTVARATHAQAVHVFRDTDWDFRLATEDRDAVLAGKVDALQDLRQSRTELKEAKVAVRSLKTVYSPDELVCEPS